MDQHPAEAFHITIDLFIFILAMSVLIGIVSVGYKSTKFFTSATNDRGDGIYQSYNSGQNDRHLSRNYNTDNIIPNELANSSIPQRHIDETGTIVSVSDTYFDIMSLYESNPVGNTVTIRLNGVQVSNEYIEDAINGDGTRLKNIIEGASSAGELRRFYKYDTDGNITEVLYRRT